jgi:WhiB family transcriptional regulator, redox-sensing transcriptional regulator
MSYENFLGALGAPHIATDSMAMGSLARMHLSVVPDLMDRPLTPDDPEWQEKALCAQTDPEAFFPEKGGSTREAKRICLGCEVRDACLEYALANDERFGIWGGLSERERRRLKRGII